MMREELEADIREDLYNSIVLGYCEDCEKLLRRGDEHEIRICAQLYRNPAQHRINVQVDGACQDCTLLCKNCDEERSVKAQERRFHAYWEG